MDADERFMTLALRAALRGVGRTCPNPPVGAVVAAGDTVVAVGHHACAGEEHAEAVALKAAGARARGATLYVTLEPCCHTGRTPPCTDAVLAAGVAAVVYAVGDPSPHCAGAGAGRLREGGVAVRAGVCAREGAELAAPFFKRIRTGLPFVTAKWAMTLDGKTATRKGDARWISSPATLALAHRCRSRVGAVLVGAGTARADDPLLTVRLPRRRQPLRVVADSGASLPPDSRLAATAADSPVLVAHGPGADAGRIAALNAAGVVTLSLPAGSRGVDLEALLRALARGVQGLGPVDHVLLEGGGELAASAMEAGLVDRVAAVVAPRLLGGRDAPTPLGGEGPDRIAQAFAVTGLKARPVGTDWLITGVPAPARGVDPVAGA